VRYFEDEVCAVLRALPSMPTLRRVGSFANFVPQGAGALQSAPIDLWDQITSQLLQLGVAFLPTGKIFLSTAHSREDVDRTISALGSVVDQLANRGPRPLV